MSNKEGIHRFDQRTPRNQIISKHYVFVQGFFHKDKMIFVIRPDGFEICYLPAGIEAKKKYSFDQLEYIEMSEINTRDLTIHLKENQ